MYDYVIVGGGSAGCVLAARLSEMPEARILLLEAGPADTHRHIKIPVAFQKMTGGRLTWGYQTAPSPHRDGHTMPYPQARVLGGGSSINAMVFTRGNPRDYDAWAEQEGCIGWSFEDVLPYFRRAEANERFSGDLHGTHGPLDAADPISPSPLSKAFVRAAQESGLPYNPDFNGAEQEGIGLYQVTQRGGQRCSAASAYLHPAMQRGNIELVVDALATRILIEHDRAVGVEYQHGGRTVVARAESEVIVAAGAIGTPKLLLLSGVGPADELAALGIEPLADLPGVGRNLQDHIDVYAIFELNGPYGYDGCNRLDRKLRAGLEYRLFRSGPATSNLAEAGGFGFADEGEPNPDIQFHFFPGTGLETGVPPLESGHGCTISTCHLRPRSRGMVTLSSADPAEPPLIDLNSWAEPYDLEMSLRGFELAREIASQPSLLKFIKKEHLPGPEVESLDDLAAYARRFGKTHYHPAGTCKMGVDLEAVVDPECRVHEIEGLRVADGSIMPRLISSDTNAAVVMIAEKASDLIRGNRGAAAG